MTATGPSCASEMTAPCTAVTSPGDIHNHGHVLGMGPSPCSLILLGDNMYLFEREEYDPQQGTGQPGEQQEKLIRARIGGGQVPFDSAKGSPSGQARVHHDARVHAAGPMSRYRCYRGDDRSREPPCPWITAEPRRGVMPCRLRHQRCRTSPHARVSPCPAASPEWDERPVFSTHRRSR